MKPFLPLLVAGAATLQAPPQDSSTKPETVRLAEIRLEGALAEKPRGPSSPFGGGSKTLRAFLGRLEKAKEDAEVAGVVLRIGSESVGGMAKAAEVRRAVARLRAAGKKVHARLEEPTPSGYLLACACDEISIEPAAGLVLPGLYASIGYVKDLLDKIGVEADVVHIGEFKTAFEDFYRSEMSEAQRESLAAILDDLFDEFLRAIAEGRGISLDRARAAVDAALLTAEQAKARGLVDHVEYDDEMRGRLANAYAKPVELAEKYGKREGAEFDPSDFMAVFRLFGEMFQKPSPPEGDKIALVYASGLIVPGKSSDNPLLGEVMGSRTMVEAIREAADDPTVKAIVMRVDSPGGSGLASDQIWREVVRAKAKKPFVVSMSDVAGSGGYYIAMAADAIVAEPTTITGSIGVIGMKFVLGGLYDKVGIRPQTLQRGKRAGMFSSDAPFTEEEREGLRRHLEAFYAQFVAKVASGRERPAAEIEKVARGRIWSGRRAKELGLVDELGGLEDAIALAKRKAGLEPDADLPLYELPEPPNLFEILEEGGFPFGLAPAYGPFPGLGPLPEVAARARAATAAFSALRRERVLALLPFEIGTD